MTDHLKHLLVRTPLEKPALLVQDVWKLRHAVLHPGLYRVHVETAAVRAAIRRLVAHPDAHCIDVGAHLGSMLSLFMELAPYGKHMAFEPTPEKAGWLRKKFPEVEVHAKALGAEPGHATFSINQMQSGFSGLRPHGLASQKFTEIEVEIARLDDLVPEERRIALLKVVVEGAELSVLQGARRILHDSRPPLIVESSASALKAWGITSRDVYDFLQDHRYSLRTPRGFLEGGLPLDFHEYTSAQKYPFDAFRFVATPR